MTPKKQGETARQNSGLTPKQKRFIEEYLTDLNATRAYLRSGYRCSEEAARRNANRLLTNADIQLAIQQANEERSRRTEITQDRVLQEEAKIAFFDPRGLFDRNGKLKPINELSADEAAAIASMEITETPEGLKTRLRFHDKGKSLERIERHLGMFNDKLKPSGNEEGPLLKIVIDGPERPKTIAEWEQQVAEAEKARKARERAEQERNNNEIGIMP